MALYLTYRPADLTEVFGNARLVKALDLLLSRPREKIPHVFLFAGPKGSGKTSLARIVAKRLGIEGSNLLEVNVANYKGVDSSREIIEQSMFRGMGGNGLKMWILDEFHEATTAAEDALLKLLEDTPDHVYFAICTTNPEKLSAPIRSRCTRFEVEPLQDKDMQALLEAIAEAEGFSVHPNAVKRIIEVSEGCPREALVILDQIRDLPDEEQEEHVTDPVMEGEVKELCQALLNRKGWKVVSEVLKKLEKTEIETIRRAVLGYMAAVLMNRGDLGTWRIMDCFVKPFYDTGRPGLKYACYAATQIK